MFMLLVPGQKASCRAAEPLISEQKAKVQAKSAAPASRVPCTYTGRDKLNKVREHPQTAQVARPVGHRLEAVALHPLGNMDPRVFVGEVACISRNQTTIRQFRSRKQDGIGKLQP